MKPLISVIIPIYNAEKYLPQCLESILEQECTDYEVIMVNDGSTDGSAAICQTYAARDSRMVLIEKAKGGVSEARNAGLQRARGKFVLFMDADDYISRDFLTIEEQFMECDVVEKAFQEVNADGTRVIKRYGKKMDRVMRDELALMTHFVSFRNNALWDKFFSREAIGDARFDEDLSVGEDLIFSVGIAHRFHTYGISTRGTYFYRKHDSSIMKRTLEDRPLYLSNLLILTQRVWDCCQSPLIAKGVVARYNIAKLFRRRKYLTLAQKRELAILFSKIGHGDLRYLSWKWKIKYMIKKIHYSLSRG